VRIRVKSNIFKKIRKCRKEEYKYKLQIKMAVIRKENNNIIVYV
jgi:hypothetical protein